MKHVKSSLRSLTRAVCGQFDIVEIPTRTIWTVANSPDTAPHVAMDFSRPALDDLHFSLNIDLLNLPEYEAAADAVENVPELSEGVVIDSGGVLHGPERTNMTRALLMNFLWRYLREGKRLDWDENRFDETLKELRGELGRKSIVIHTTLPLSNLKMDIDVLDFGDELKLVPASIEELERWLNPDRGFPPLGTGPPQWNTQYVDRPAVLHARRSVVGLPPPTNPQEALGNLPRVNADQAITALRLVLNAPISIVFHEQVSEGMMAFGGRSTRWGWTPPTLGPVATLDDEKATHAIQVWQQLKSSRNTKLMRLPLRRWESSLLRTNPEDRLIDAWISLESLLLGGLQGELSYRAALRLAEFLGSSGIERNNIYDVMRVSYRWRSMIVHGLKDKKFTRKNPLRETVVHTIEYLRLALLSVLNLPRRFDPNTLESDLIGRESGSP